MKGFTLIEGIVVVIILAIMGAVVVPAVIYTGSSSDYSTGINGVVEVRCINGFNFVIGKNGSTQQMMDAEGNGVRCSEKQ